MSGLSAQVPSQIANIVEGTADALLLAMSDIDRDRLTHVQGGIGHPANDPMGAKERPHTYMQDFKNWFERNRQ